MKRPLGIYIHIPFCVRKCKYCDFLSGPANEDTQKKYAEMLSNIPGIKLIAEQEGVTYNYSYMPVFFDGYKYTRDEVQNRLQEHNIWARKYFYPIVPDLTCYQEQYAALDFPNSRHAADTVLALPMYADLSVEDVDRICKIILE